MTKNHLIAGSLALLLSIFSAVFAFRVGTEIAKSISRDDEDNMRRIALVQIQSEHYVKEAMRQFPQLRDSESPLRRACTERFAELSRERSPVLDRPEYPLIIANEQAAILGITPTVVTK